MGTQSTVLNFISDGGVHDKVSKSCGVIFNGQFFIYGGAWKYDRQIAKVNDCSLEIVGSLEFYFSRGGCTNANNQILLCFPKYSKRSGEGVLFGPHPKTCYSSMNPMGPFTTIDKSIYEHEEIRIASSECNFYLAYILNWFSSSRRSGMWKQIYS